MQPSFDRRDELDVIEAQRTGKMDERDDADKDSNAALLQLVNGVKGDPDEGEDGELYEAMGYVRKSERQSGLTHKPKPGPTPPPTP